MLTFQAYKLQKALRHAAIPSNLVIRILHFGVGQGGIQNSCCLWTSVILIGLKQQFHMALV